MAALVGLALCVLLSSCTEMAKCRAKEKDDFPVLESLASSVMADVGHGKLARSSFCDTTGKFPGASVSVEVPEWVQSSDAVAYLRSRGYTFGENGSGLSADGRYFASVQGPLRDRGRGADIMVSFSLVGDVRHRD